MKNNKNKIKLGIYAYVEYELVPSEVLTFNIWIKLDVSRLNFLSIGTYKPDLV